MKIGIVGSGAVGQTLALGALKHGYEVMLGTGKQSKYAELKEKTGGRAMVGSFQDAAKFGDLLVLAVKGTIAVDALKVAGIANFVGKTVLDVNNPQTDDPPEKGVLNFFTTYNESLMERLQAEAPDVNFVKAFNCIGSEMMVNPDFGGLKPTMFICGNNDGAKQEATQFIEKFGFEVEDLGSVVSARVIEPLCNLWYIPGFQKNEWRHALRLLK